MKGPVFASESEDITHICGHRSRLMITNADLEKMTKEEFIEKEMSLPCPNLCNEARQNALAKTDILNVRMLVPNDKAKFIHYLITVPGKYREEEAGEYVRENRLPNCIIVGEVWQQKRNMPNPEYGYDPEAAAKDLAGKGFCVTKRLFKGE